MVFSIMKNALGRVGRSLAGPDEKQAAPTFWEWVYRPSGAFMAFPLPQGGTGLPWYYGWAGAVASGPLPSDGYPRGPSTVQIWAKLPRMKPDWKWPDTPFQPSF
jgi:hypothetical protein